MKYQMETDACHLDEAIEFLSLSKPYYSFEYGDVEIDDNEIRIMGLDGEYLSVTPDDVELYDYKWNGVSVKPKTSSYVIKSKS